MEAKASGCRHDFDQAAFDGRHLVARRTHTAVCSTSAELPMQVRTALVASWAPPEWLLLSAEYGADAALRLDGAFWGMHVSYEPIALRIDRILDPYLSQPLRFEEGGGQNFLAFGAAATQLP